jgi:hypothetical protein
MAKKKKKIVKVKRKGPKVVTVHTYPRRVKPSKKNPDGITMVDEHPRHIQGTYLDEVEIESTVKAYDKKNIIYPAKNRLEEFPDSDKYDDLIAVWTDYFNKKFKSSLDPDMVKALIASESGFEADPGNPLAGGITQITRSTYKTLQDPKGEAKKFIFKNVSWEDLKNPNVAIPMGIRWLYIKKDLAKHDLKREPTHEEIILEYKGWLMSNTPLKTKGLENYRKNYAKLKTKK